ncbi:MAG: hypothetical protein ISS81_05155 [Candidatus Marinimicrobia bacterium]|nr:hypothetical protein [Candidatus Neomarinimicrobiota bacterium]
MNVSDNKTSLQAYIDNNAGSLLFSLLGDYRLQDNEAEEAIEACRSGLTKYPNSALGHYIWALAAIKMDNIGMGVEHLKTTIQLDRGFLQAYYKLTEIGKGVLDLETLKKCYERIFQLNPFDSHAEEQVETITSTAPSVVAEEVEKPLEPEIEEAEPPEPVQEAGEFIEPELDVTVPEQLSEEEAHLGPIEPEILEKEEEPTEIPSEESAVPAEEDIITKKETYPEKETASAQASVRKSKLDEMFSKLKSKPLDEVQKESWDISGFGKDQEVAVPEVEESPVPSKEEVTLEKDEPVKKTVFKEKIKSPDYIQDKVASLVRKPEEKPPEKEEKPSVTSTKRKVPKKKSVKKTVKKETVDDRDRIELKIPIPTLTLVEVLKKQKLYDQALDVLNILEKKSKNVEKVKKVREEIVQLKAEENNSQ